LAFPADDVLKRFLLGQSTEAEERLVLEYLEKGGEAAGRLDRLDQKLGFKLSGNIPSVHGREPAFWHGLHAARHLMALKVGDSALGSLSFGPYILQKRIDHGGMGRVYIASDTRNQGLVALKSLEVEDGRDPDALRRFRRESSIITSLEHPNIVKCFEAGEFQGKPFIAMELLSGRDLGALIKDGASFGPESVAEIGRGVSLALSELETRELVHRDVKPSNLFLTVDGVVKVLDLGLACQLSSTDSSLTGNDWVLGTFDYMAPEQALDTKSADGRSDIYSLGCTLFALLAGHPPYPSPKYSTPLKKALAHSSVPFPDICKIRPEINPGLASVLLKMCSKDPGERYQKPSEVFNALAPFSGANPLENVISWLMQGQAQQTVRKLLEQSEFSTGYEVTKGIKGRSWIGWWAVSFSILVLIASLGVWSLNWGKPIRQNLENGPHNLIENGSFKEGFKEWGYQTGGENVGEFVIDETKGCDDSYSIRHSSKVESSNSATALVSPPIRVEVGRKYKLSACFDASMMTEGNLSLDLADTHGIRLNAEIELSGWQEINHEFIARDKVIRIRIIRDGKTIPGEFGWVDKVRLEKCCDN
jgi:serine/threonine protein kinase